MNSAFPPRLNEAVQQQQICELVCIEPVFSIVVDL